nr:MAG TPA: hypothetical protein [Caudoviricetes sp.]
MVRSPFTRALVHASLNARSFSKGYLMYEGR